MAGHAASQSNGSAAFLENMDIFRVRIIRQKDQSAGPPIPKPSIPKNELTNGKARAGRKPVHGRRSTFGIKFQAASEPNHIWGYSHQKLHFIDGRAVQEITERKPTAVSSHHFVRDTDHGKHLALFVGCKINSKWPSK